MQAGELNGVTNARSDTWFDAALIQSVAIAPTPGNTHDYYVFYWNRANEQGQTAYALSWARVDMRLNNGHGAVAEKGQRLTTTFGPRVTVVRHQNNRDFWVLTRDLSTRGFQAFLLSTQGVSRTPVVSLARQGHYPDYGELKAAPNGRRLASGAIERTGTLDEGLVCVYDFDNATGMVSNEMVVRRRPTSPFAFYTDGRPNGYATLSCSFSPNSQLLYAVEGPPEDKVSPRRNADLWQYDLSQSSPEAIAASRFWVSNAPLPARSYDGIDCYGVQLAPDGTLWASRFYRRADRDPDTGQFQAQAAAVVRYPNVAGAGCRFEPEAFPYRPGQIPSPVLPNLITNMLYAPPALNHEQACPDDSVQFWASSAGAPAGLRWDFGDPSSGAANAATGQYVAHRYARGGSYAVRLTLADGRVLTQTLAVAALAVDFTSENIFTPNGDGLNDEFIPVREALPGGRLRVFGRWGQAVFSTDDAARLRWNGDGAAAGEYFYLLEYADCAGQPRRRRGTLTLVR